MKKLIVLAIVALGVLPAKAQYDSAVAMSKISLSLQIDAAQVFNPIDPSMMISGELMFRGRVSLIPEVGILPVIRQYENVEISQFYKFQQGIRFYAEKYKREKANFYIGFHVQYRQLTINERYVLGFECPSANSCLYYRNYTGDIKTERFSYLIITGGQSTIGNRLVLGWSMGCGVRNYTVDREQVFGGTFIEEDRFLEEGRFGQSFTANASIKIGVLIF